MKDTALNILNDWNFTESKIDRLSELNQIVAGTIQPVSRDNKRYEIVIAQSDNLVLLHVNENGIWEQYIGKVNEPDIVARLLCRALADMHYRLS